MSSLRIVLLTGSDLEHRYVANVLCERVPIAAIVSVSEPSVSPSDRLGRLVQRYTFRELIDRAFLHGLSILMRDRAHRERELRRILGDGCLAFERSDLVSRIAGLRSDASFQSVACLRPDVLAVYGTRVVPPELLSLASTIALNLHTGLSPYYRGADCDFWPLYNHEPDLLGVTVHECTARIDGGAIFATRRVQLERDDDRFTVFPRLVEAGAPLYADVLESFLRETPRGSWQDASVGREYRIAMKGFIPELVVRTRIRRGLIRKSVGLESEGK